MEMSRSRISFLAGGVTLLLLVGLLIQQRFVSTGKPDSGTATISVRSGSAGRTSASAPRRSLPQVAGNLPELPSPVQPPQSAGSAEVQEWIARRIDEMDALSWNDDIGSLEMILAELRSPVPEIRTAALEAVRSFGSRDAIPYLATLARNSNEPLEQKNLTDLIDFLNRPTLLEVSDFDSIE